MPQIGEKGNTTMDEHSKHVDTSQVDVASTSAQIDGAHDDRGRATTGRPTPAVPAFAEMIATSMPEMFAPTYVNTYRGGREVQRSAFLRDPFDGRRDRRHHARIHAEHVSETRDQRRDRGRQPHCVLSHIVARPKPDDRTRGAVHARNEPASLDRDPHKLVGRQRRRPLQATPDQTIGAQKREVEEMNWMLNDIEANGTATTDSAGDARPVPESMTTDVDG